MSNSLRDSACGYVVDKGWAVLPLLTKSKLPNPVLVPHGFKEATKCAAKVLHWWERYPDGNIGIACRASGLVVIDIDPRNGGKTEVWPATLSSLTGGGGWHHYYQHPGVPTVGKLGDGVDVKDNGYVLAPPSSTDNPYSWLPGPKTPTQAPPMVIREHREGNPTPKPRMAGERLLGPLDDISTIDYFEALTGREVIDGFAHCPFHKEGKERTPSFYCNGTLWCCYACEPKIGQEALGGNIYTFAGLLWGYPLPLRGADFAEIEARLKRMFDEPS